jgi:hypothetical protein
MLSSIEGASSARRLDFLIGNGGWAVMKIATRWDKRMGVVLAIALLVSVFPARPFAPSDTFESIKLLEGYSARRGSAVDAVTWTIEKQSGPLIHFEAGFSEGLWADPKEADSYAWSRTQTINGYKTLFALVKPGLKTHWEPKNERGLPPGNILLVTVLLGGDGSFHTANFAAKVKNNFELADVLLMVATFDPSKGTF